MKCSETFQNGKKAFYLPCKSRFEPITVISVVKATKTIHIRNFDKYFIFILVTQVHTVYFEVNLFNHFNHGMFCLY